MEGNLICPKPACTAEEPLVCGRCHGKCEVLATCACGCGVTKHTTCPRCHGSGMEPTANKYWLNAQKGVTWLSSKLPF